MPQLFFIGVFGLVGIFCRHGTDQFFTEANQSFPVSTLVINVVGSFIAGLIFVIGEREGFPPAVQSGLLVGFCGGFTTFSAYALQTMQMLDKGRVAPGLVYLVVGPLLGLVAAAVPILAARKLLPSAL